MTRLLMPLILSIGPTAVVVPILYKDPGLASAFLRRMMPSVLQGAAVFWLLSIGLALAVFGIVKFVRSIRARS